MPHLKKVIPPSLCIENNYSRYLLFYKKSEEKKRILSNRRTSFAWIPPAPPRVKNLSCIVLMYHRLDLSSNSNWNVSWSDISSWLAVTSTPEKLIEKKKLYHQNSRCGPNSWILASIFAHQNLNLSIYQQRHISYLVDLDTLLIFIGWIGGTFYNCGGWVNSI